MGSTPLDSELATSLQLLFLIDENILGKCSCFSSSFSGPRIPGQDAQYEYPQPLLLIVVKKTTEKEPESYPVIPGWSALLARQL